MTPYRIVLAQVDSIMVVSKKIGYQTLIDDDLIETTREVWEVTLTNHAEKQQCVTLHWNTRGFQWVPAYETRLKLSGNQVKVAGFLKQTPIPFGNRVVLLPGQARVQALIIKSCNDGD